MALYTLRLEDGTEEFVRAHPNATKEELAVLLDKMLAERKAMADAERKTFSPEAQDRRLTELLSKLPQRDTSVWEDLTRGLGAGVVTGAGSGAGVIYGCYFNQIFLF